MRTIKGYLDEWRVQEYLLITFFISWLSWGALIVLTALKVISFMSVIGIALFMIGGFGPTLSAIICLEGKLSWKKIGKFIFAREPKTWWVLILMSILLAVVIGLSSMETNPEIAIYALPVMLIVCTLFGGGNEELGWRGTLQPLWERTVNKKIKSPILGFLVMALAIGAIWAIWHLPLWFVTGSPQQQMAFGWFFLATLFESIFLACIYAKTRSVFYCMIFHGLSNVLLSWFIIKVNWLLALGFIALAGLATVIATCKFKNGKSQAKK